MNSGRMAAGTNRKKSASPARAHTRRTMAGKTIYTVFLDILKHTLWILFLAFSSSYFHLAIRPPPSKICGSECGPPITSSRIQLTDGRYLAYIEKGVPKEKAKHNILYVHGFDSSRHGVASITSNLSQDVVENYGLYIVSFDRPGYGESDPNPKQTEKSLASDIEELANQLGLGQNFYVIGFSMGGQIVWKLLKHIPHRFAGAALIAPVVNYWWRNIPSNLSKEGFEQQLLQDQFALRVAHHFPYLIYWWNTQIFFPPLSIIARSEKILSQQDRELLPQIFDITKDYVSQARQQGDFESVHRDLAVGFGKWEFDPTELNNPFLGNKGSVHLWQGDEDILVPVKLQRHIADKLPWIHYHEVSGAGHLFPYADGMADSIIKELLHVNE